MNISNYNPRVFLTDLITTKLNFFNTHFRKTRSQSKGKSTINSSNQKRAIDILVLSDLHLGTYGANAKALYHYLQSIAPKKVILNGDIIDMWLFSKNKWPEGHTLVIKEFLSYLANGIDIYYVTGNHDEFLRKFEGLSLGTLHIVNQHTEIIDGKKTWFLHGDVFDVSVKSKQLAKLGGYTYDFLVLFNQIINKGFKMIGLSKVNFSKQIKKRSKQVIKKGFEKDVLDTAYKKNMDYVVCGHIHQACISTYIHESRPVTYMNSGDWIESLTALEYNLGKWELYDYRKDSIASTPFVESNFRQEPSLQELLGNLKADLAIL